MIMLVDNSLHRSNRCVQPGWGGRSTPLHQIARAGTGALVHKSEFTRPCVICRGLDIACSALEVVACDPKSNKIDRRWVD